MIVRRGQRYVVKSKGGRTLGVHATEREAQAQLAAIEAAKARQQRAAKG